MYSYSEKQVGKKVGRENQILCLIKNKKYSKFTKMTLTSSSKKQKH